MTEEEKKAIEAEEAKKAAEVAAAAKVDEKDEADVALELFEALQKSQAERDNYREGLLKAKGKKPEDETDEERIERIVNEKMASSNVGSLLKEFQTKLAKVVHENKELKVANRSKSSMESKTGGGAGGGKEDVSNDPLASIPADLRARLANVREASRNKLIEKWRAAQIIK